MRFSSLDLDPFACTHLVYAFATMDPHSFTIMPQDEEYDIVKGKMLWNVLQNGTVKTSRILDWYDSDPGYMISQWMSYCLCEIHKLIPAFQFSLIQGCSFKTGHCLGHVSLAAVIYWIFFNVQKITASLNGLCRNSSITASLAVLKFGFLLHSCLHQGQYLTCSVYWINSLNTVIELLCHFYHTCVLFCLLLKWTCMLPLEQIKIYDMESNGNWVFQCFTVHFSIQ